MTEHDSGVIPLLVVLDSEVVDLRVCLQSADRELAEIKAELKKEKRSHDMKTMELLRRVSPQSKHTLRNRYMLNAVFEVLSAIM